MTSSLLLQCLRFTLSENEEGNFTLGRLFLVLPPCISCTGKELLPRVIVKVAVIVVLSVDPFISTELDPFGASILLKMVRTLKAFDLNYALVNEKHYFLRFFLACSVKPSDKF